MLWWNNLPLCVTSIESWCWDERYGLVVCTDSTVSHPIWPSNCCTKWIQFLFLLSMCSTHLMSHIIFRFMQRGQLGLWVELLQLLCLLVQMHLFLSKANIELLTWLMFTISTSLILQVNIRLGFYHLFLFVCFRHLNKQFSQPGTILSFHSIISSVHIIARC